MKFSKIFSAAAAIAAAGMMTVSASAALVVPTSVDPGASFGTGQVLFQIFNEGNEAENKPATDYGIDLSKVAKLTATITLDTTVEEDMLFYTGAVGGALVLSINGGDIGSSGDLFDKYNWVGSPSKAWWGMIDPDLGIETYAEQDCTVETLSKGVYKIVSPAYDNPLANGDANTIGCMQVSLQMWGDATNFSTFTLNEIQALDADGNVLLTFNETGVATVGAGASSSNNNNAGNDGASSGDNASSGDASNNGDSNNAGASNPSAGNNVDTGGEGVAAVVGVAALAAGAVVLSRKRK